MSAGDETSHRKGEKAEQVFVERRQRGSHNAVERSRSHQSTSHPDKSVQQRKPTGPAADHHDQHGGGLEGDETAASWDSRSVGHCRWPRHQAHVQHLPAAAKSPSLGPRRRHNHHRSRHSNCHVAAVTRKSSAVRR